MSGQAKKILVLVLFVAGAFALFTLPYVLEDERPMPLPAKTKLQELDIPPPPVPVPPKQPQLVRLPVAGSRNQIVILPDGSSYLEMSDGGKQPLTGPRPKIEPIQIVPIKDKPPEEPKQLVVVDKGVLSLPASAIITYLGDDHVVTHDVNNVSVVYFVDGRIEKRDRTTLPKSK